MDIDVLFDKYEELLFDIQQNTGSIKDWIDDTVKLRKIRYVNNKCKDCKIEFVLNSNDQFTCPGCGVQSNSNDFTSTDYIKKQSYKRLTHFKDWLIKTQARHSPEIDNQIIRECKFNNYMDYDSIKKYLKESGNAKHYEDIYYIISIINPSFKLFNLNSNETKQITQLFLTICKIWLKIKPKKRKSIISYQYIIRKLLSMIGRSDLKHYFNKPKFNKLLEYNSQWKKIINHPEFTYSV